MEKAWQRVLEEHRPFNFDAMRDYNHAVGELAKFECCQLCPPSAVRCPGHP